MTHPPETESRPPAVDVRQLLRHNYQVLARWLGVRLIWVTLLIATPLVAINVFHVPNTFWTILPSPAGVFLLIWTFPRLGCGVRLLQCARVLRVYPLEFYPTVRRKPEAESTSYSTVYTVRLRVQGVKDEPWLWAINAAGLSTWPEGTEDGVWFAGDLPFGGVILVPAGNGLLYLNPADWEKEAPRRAEAGPERQARAKSAKLHRRNWKKPNMV